MKIKKPNIKVDLERIRKGLGHQATAMKTFYFNTGVKPENRTHLAKGAVWRGTMQFPFDCEDVPDGAVFQFASDQTAPGDEHLLRREMHNTTMVSKYAFFKLP